MSSASGSRAIPEAHAFALARIYALAIQKYQEKQMAAGRLPSPDGRNDAKEIKNDCAVEPKYNR